MRRRRSSSHLSAQTTASQSDHYLARSSSETSDIIDSQISDIQLGDAGRDLFTQSEPCMADFMDVVDAGGTAEDNLSEDIYSQQTAYASTTLLNGKSL